MFFMTMPVTFQVGDTANVRINKQPATLLWRDQDHLVINSTDVRTIMRCDRGPDGAGRDCWSFICTDAETPREHYFDSGSGIVRDDGKGWRK